MANGNDVDVAPVVKMMDATPVTWHLGNGKKIDGRYKAPDMSHIPRETEHLFATNSGDILVSADDLKTLSEKVEAALQEKEEKKRNLGEPKRPY